MGQIAINTNLGTLTGVTATIAQGATDTSSATTVTLTNSSTQEQNITMTASGQFVVLPDATTLGKGGSIFIITNRGYYPFGVKDSAGNIIMATVSSQLQQAFTLLDNSTAAGKWATGLTNLQLSVPTTINTTTGTVGPNNWIACVGLSSSLIVMAYYDTVGGGSKVVAGTVSGTTITFGTPVSTALVDYPCSIIAYSATQFVLSSYDGTPNAIIRAGSVSGTTVTLGSTTTSNVGSTNIQANMATMINSTTGVWAYNNNSTGVAFKAFTVSGTTMTFGAAVNAATDTNGSPLALFQTASGVCMFSTDSNTTNGCGFITNSGTVLTIGTTYTGATYGDKPRSYIGTNTVKGRYGIYTLSGNTITSYAQNRYTPYSNSGYCNLPSFSTGISVNASYSSYEINNPYVTSQTVQVSYATNGTYAGFSSYNIPISIGNSLVNIPSICILDSSTAVVCGGNYTAPQAMVLKLLWS